MASARSRSPRGKDAVDGALARFHAEADSAAEWLHHARPDAGDGRRAETRAEIKKKLEAELRALLDLAPSVDPHGFLPDVDGVGASWESANGGGPMLATKAAVCLSCHRPTSGAAPGRSPRVLSAHRQFAAQNHGEDHDVVWRAGFKMPFANQFYQVDRPRSPPVAEHSVFSASRSITVNDPRHHHSPERHVFRSQTPETWINQSKQERTLKNKGAAVGMGRSQ